MLWWDTHLTSGTRMMRSSVATFILAAACLCLTLPASSQTPNRKDMSMTLRAAGTFDVKTTPLPPDEVTGGPAIGRYALNKQFRGDLEAAGKGEMLGSGDPAQGQAGYVAIEIVTGTLRGRSGSFALQHSGVMQHGQFTLNVTVVPGSGTGQLAGITGTMTISSAAGIHSYSFVYTLPGAQ